MIFVAYQRFSCIYQLVIIMKEKKHCFLKKSLFIKLLGLQRESLMIGHFLVVFYMFVMRRSLKQCKKREKSYVRGDV
jgi:hypothetical protein